MLTLIFPSARKALFLVQVPGRLICVGNQTDRRAGVAVEYPAEDRCIWCPDSDAASARAVCICFCIHSGFFFGSAVFEDQVWK